MRYIFLFLFLFTLFPVHAQMYASLDNKAKNAPTFKTEGELVDYLTKNLEDDKSKARVIAAWIVYQVERDGWRRKELIKYSNQNRAAPKQLDNDTFHSRIGTPQDFANLYAVLGRLAGLEVEVIDGIAGENIQAFRYQEPKGRAIEVLFDSLGANNYQLQRYRSGWNAVKINDKWNLVDTYWMISNDKLFAAQNLQSERSMEMLLEQRTRNTPNKMKLIAGKRIDDRYFFGKARFFIKTHFPLNPEWQLLPVPYAWSSFISR